MKFRELLNGCSDLCLIRIATSGCGIYFEFHSEDKQKLIDILGGCPVKKLSISMKYGKIVISVILADVGYNISEHRETAGLFHKCKYYDNGYCHGMKCCPCVSCGGAKCRCEQ